MVGEFNFLESNYEETVDNPQQHLSGNINTPSVAVPSTSTQQRTTVLTPQFSKKVSQRLISILLTCLGLKFYWLEVTLDNF